MSNRPVVHSVGPVDAGEPWQVTVHVDTSSGVPRCVGLDVRGFAGEPGSPDKPSKEARPLSDGEVHEVTGAVLRGLSVPRLFEGACADLHVLALALLSPEEAEPLRATLRERGRKYDLAHYEQVAEVYTGALGSGAPTKAVRERFHLSEAAAKKQVATCRRLGLLGPARGPGQAGGRVVKP